MPPKDPTPGRSRGLHVVASDDDGAVVVADLEQLCRSGVAGLSPVAGAVVHLAPVGVASSVVAASAPEWERIGELADLLGEGPCIDAARMLRPVLVPDLAADRHRWPTYSVALAQVGVRGVFSFPLQVGAVNVGVLDLYAVTRTDLEPPDLALALAIAQVATSVLLTGSQASPRPDDPVHPPRRGPLGRRDRGPEHLAGPRRGPSGAGHADGLPGGRPGRGDARAARTGNGAGQLGVGPRPRHRVGGGRSQDVAPGHAR